MATKTEACWPLLYHLPRFKKYFLFLSLPLNCQTRFSDHLIPSNKWTIGYQASIDTNRNSTCLSRMSWTWCMHC